MKKETSKEKALRNVDYCTSYILQKIESGELASGERLGEPSLAKELGVERAAVRSAFERLSASGILERKARSGTYLKGMSMVEIEAANQVRCQLEVLGARLAAIHATEAELDQLERTAELVDNLFESYVSGQISVWSSIRSLEIEFHTMIARFSRNSFLLSMLNRDSFLQVCFPFLVVSKSIRIEQTRKYHADIIGNKEVIKAIRSRDPEHAAEVMARHVEGSLILYRRVLKES